MVLEQPRRFSEQSRPDDETDDEMVCVLCLNENTEFSGGMRVWCSKIGNKRLPLRFKFIDTGLNSYTTINMLSLKCVRIFAKIVSPI